MKGVNAMKEALELLKAMLECVAAGLLLLAALVSTNVFPLPWMVSEEHNNLRPYSDRELGPVRNGDRVPME